MASDFFFLSSPPSVSSLFYRVCHRWKRNIVLIYFEGKGNGGCDVDGEEWFLLSFPMRFNDRFFFPLLSFSSLLFSFLFLPIPRDWVLFSYISPRELITSYYYRNKGTQYRNIIIIIIIITKARSFIIIFSFSPRCKRFSRDTDKNSYLYNRITHIQIFHPIGSSSRRNL